ncbi:MAG: DciA family protein [Wenzhouxiangellaceae bacterium]
MPSGKRTNHRGSPGSGEHAGARRVDTIARAQGGIGPGLRRAEAYLALNERVRALIPEGARGEITIACVERDCLVIAAASSARAAQARLLADSLLEAVRNHWPEELARTRVIVTPGLNLN